MNDIEYKLNKFREQNLNDQNEKEKARGFGHYFSYIGNKLESFWEREKVKKNENSKRSELEPKRSNNIIHENSHPKPKRLQAVNFRPNQSNLSSHSDEEEMTEKNKDPTDYKMNAIKIVLKVLLWLILFTIFFKFEFAAVYFIVSLLVIIYFNTRNSKEKRKKDQLSAYSVFNPNLEQISGTITPEKLQKSFI
jgi:hypothetical protein